MALPEFSQTIDVQSCTSKAPSSVYVKSGGQRRSFMTIANNNMDSRSLSVESRFGGGERMQSNREEADKCNEESKQVYLAKVN